jgi:predicted O-methyltransferase YrrM
MRLARFLVGLFVPHSLVLLRWDYLARRQRAERQRALAAVESMELPLPSIGAIERRELIEFLVSAGLDRTQVEEGSMDAESLAFCGSLLRGLPSGQPLRGLHIGNFVGVSLAYFSHVARAIDPGSRMVSIDPNIPHRGVKNPQAFVISLLGHLGLEGINTILTGYSLEKGISNDGMVFGGYDPVAAYLGEQSLTHQLESLWRLGAGPFDFSVLDGNHDPRYLRREIALVERLLKAGGLLFLDDISISWPDLAQLFEGLEEGAFRKVGHNGRVGVLRRE